MCRLVIERKKLWILDEPYAGLDESTYELINETLYQLATEVWVEKDVPNTPVVIFSVDKIQSK